MKTATLKFGKKNTSNMEERYDTGIWYWTIDGGYLYFRGMLGDAHESEEAAMDTIRKQTASDVSDGVVEEMKSKGVVIIYFLCHVIPQDDHSSLFDMSSYVSESYGDEVIKLLKDYDSYQRIGLHVI